MVKRIIVWLIRKAIQMYPEEAFIPPGKHLHKNPRRKPVEFHEGEIIT